MSAPGYDPTVTEGGVRMIIFAGANGSGKSTALEYIRKDANFPGIYINADDIAKSDALKHISDPTQRNLVAAQQADAQRQSALKRHEAFALETVLSTGEKIALITQARTAGYDVQVAFVTTSSDDINVRRVAGRVAAGGHPVPEDRIRSRYREAMRLLPHAFDHATRGDAFDNSVDGGSVLWVAHKSDGQFSRIADPPPSWYHSALESPYLALQTSKKELAEQFRDYIRSTGDRASQILVADASQGRNYVGRVIAVTDKHVMQEHTQSSAFIVHDRLFTPGREFRIGHEATISYQYDRGKIVHTIDEMRGPER